jgi:ABC-type nitrate/sulfonate/bicarbonate transport system permease component
MPRTDIFYPGLRVGRPYRVYIAVTWLVCTAVLWSRSPFVFLPKPAEVATALHDLWFYQDLGIELVASVQLNIESIAIATLISLSLAYLGTIAIFEPIVSFIGKLRFLSLYGLGFAFTIMASSGHELKVAILVFMVVVYFVVGMVDVIASIPQEQYDLAHTLRMGDWETLYEVVIFGQLDQAFIILRQTAAMSWMMVSVAESMSMSGGGVGALLLTSNKHFHMAEVMAIQIMILIVGLAQDALIGWLRTTCCPWVKKSRGK